MTPQAKSEANALGNLYHLGAPRPTPADAVAAFGPPVEAGEFAGCFTVATENTAKTGTHATRDGIEYVHVVLSRGFTGMLALWVPVE